MTFCFVLFLMHWYFGVCVFFWLGGELEAVVLIPGCLEFCLVVKTYITCIQRLLL